MGALKHIDGLWLDVTRLLTRIGRGALTGIDRVELAYLREALTSECDRYICRTTRGYLLLDQKGARHLLMLAEGTAVLGRADWLSRLLFRGNRPRHRAEAALRGFAIDRCRPRHLPDLLTRRRLGGLSYLNVGHSNLSETMLSAVAAQNGARLCVLLHDLIPLLDPDWVAVGQPKRFARRIETVRRYASTVFVTSSVTLTQLNAHWDGAGRLPSRFVVPLGVERRPLSEKRREPGHFVMLGTIEPRKNHALIVTVWELLADDLPPERMPHLHIIGATGWRVEALMARLDSHPLLNKFLHLHGALPDADVQDHLARATALLFPSLAEGYGYPPLEAAMAGALPICSNLSVFRETLGDCAVYVDSSDAYQWKETIKQHLLGRDKTPDLTKLKVPTWQEHFEAVAEAMKPRASRERP